MILNKFEALKILANKPIIFTYYSESELSTSTIKYVDEQPLGLIERTVWSFKECKVSLDQNISGDLVKTFLNESKVVISLQLKEPI